LKKNTRIIPDLPCWAGYRDILQALSSPHIPPADMLTRLLPPDTANQRGLPIQFVAASGLDVRDYEKHIYETGEVSTREDDWHDLFNAFVWCRFPKLKAAMNARHYGELGSEKSGRRGSIRDALTLLDESGVIVSGREPDVLQALAEKDWNSAFVTHCDKWGTGIRVTVCGHAILEKFLNPYKSVTAHALLLHTPEMLPVAELDRWLAKALLECEILESPASLSPLPLMGIPGWWQEGKQNEAFYGDRDVFRPDTGRRAPALVHELTID
jgi:hypothetical protein